jgi:hypothetical protein
MKIWERSIHMTWGMRHKATGNIGSRLSVMKKWKGKWKLGSDEVKYGRGVFGGGGIAHDEVKYEDT